MNRSSKNLAYSLMLGASVLALTGGTAIAQDQSTTVETVVVTGSLIPRAAMGDTAVPTNIVSAIDIEKSGFANIAQVLSQVPQIQTGGGDLTPTNSNFLTSGFGVSNIDLRDLGPTRTLVLVNGQRWVTGSPTSTAVDLNSIPTQLISRVDVITGGASATYGSDAIAGVVNIILKSDFEGLQATAQYGESSRGDGGDEYLSLLVGGNFLNDRGNVAVVMSYDISQAVESGNRDLTQTDAAHYPGFFGCYGTVDCTFLGGATYSSYAPAGRYRWMRSNGSGNLTYAGGSFNPDGSTFNLATDGFDRNPHRFIQVPITRTMVAETGHIQIAPWLRFTFDGAYALTSSKQRLEPYPGTSEDGLSTPYSAGGQGILIPLSNPFIPADLMATYYQPVGGNPYDANSPADYGSPGLFYYRRFGDFGNRTGSVDRDLARVALGLDGDYGALKNQIPFLSDWTWKFSYVWGQTKESQTNGGYYDKIKMEEALNARLPAVGETAPAGGGGYICNDPIAQAGGCVPINLFGANSITPEAASYVGSLITLQDRAVEQVATISTTGSLFSLPAGDVEMAVGAEYRSEWAMFVPDAASQAGTVAGNQVPATQGQYFVHEAFGELRIPLLKDLPFAEYLEVDASGRFSNYSTAGTATTWNLGGVWQPLDSLKFRGQLSSATRAPNISELFTPNAQTFPGISNDICAAPTTANEVANCATDIANQAPGVLTTPSYSGSTGLAAKQGVGGYQSGNPNLKPETAHTLTLGLVYTPEWLQPMQITVDYYDIRIYGYIGGLGTQTTQQACYDADPAGFATNVFCQQITRQYDSVLGPIIKQINFPSFNLGSIKTKGVDGSISYALQMADLDDGLENAGSFIFKLDGTYVGNYDTDPGVPGTSVIYSGGDIGVEQWRGRLTTTYDNGPFSATMTLRYIGPGYVSREDIYTTSSALLPANHITSVWYTDMQVSYDFTKEVGVYLGAHNLFDVQPPETYIGAFDDTGTGTATTVYDPIGLYVYGGVTLKL